MLFILAALLATEPPPHWQLLFADPPNGSAYVDTASTWSRGEERGIYVRFAFTAARERGEVERLARFEINCRTRGVRVRSVIANDRHGRQVYGYAYDDRQAGIVAEPAGPSARLLAAACAPGFGH